MKFSSRIRTVLVYGLAAIAAFYCFRHLSLLVFRNGPRGDLDILYRAGQRFLEGAPVYLLQEDSEHTKPPLLSPLLAGLSLIPQDVVRLLWDLLTLSLPFATLALWARVSEQRLSWVSVAGAIALVGPLWFSESGYGQFNLLLLLLVLIVMRWSRPEEGRVQQIGAGALTFGMILLKPTQIFFLPLLSQTGQGRLRSPLTWAFGIAVGALASIALYLAFRPWPVLITDLREWSSFIQLSQQKHLLRVDNFGLPTLLARAQFGFAGSPAITLAGLALAAWVAFKVREITKSLSWTLIITLAFSPMSWRQNFVLLLPLAYELFRLAFCGKRLAWIGLVALFAVARVSAHWIPGPLMDYWGMIMGPTLCALLAAAVFQALPSGMADLGDSLKK